MWIIPCQVLLLSLDSPAINVLRVLFGYGMTGDYSKYNMKDKKSKGKKPKKDKKSKKSVKTDKKPNGRPPKYYPEVCNDIIKFFDRKPYTIKITKAFGKTFRTKAPCDLPTLEGFANSIEVCRDTLYEWSTAEKDGKLKYPDFSYALKRAKEYQKNILVTNGLSGAYNGTFAIFTAKNVTDMKDKIETELGEDTRKTLQGIQDNLQRLANAK